MEVKVLTQRFSYSHGGWGTDSRSVSNVAWDIMRQSFADLEPIAEYKIHGPLRSDLFWLLPEGVIFMDYCWDQETSEKRHYWIPEVDLENFPEICQKLQKEVNADNFEPIVLHNNTLKWLQQSSKAPVLRILEFILSIYSGMARAEGCGCDHNLGWCQARGCGDAYIIREVQRGVEIEFPGKKEEAIKFIFNWYGPKAHFNHPE